MTDQIELLAVHSRSDHARATGKSFEPFSFAPVVLFSLFAAG